MVAEPAPEGDEREMLLSVVEPEKPPVPAAVGAREGGEDEEKPPDEGGALDQPAVQEPDDK